MGPQVLLSLALKEKMLELQNRNPSYSLRSFARRLNVSSGALSEILNGKRTVSVKKATEIMDRLALSPDVRERILKSYQETHLNVSQGKDNLTPLEYLKLSSDQFESISDWKHFAILSLINTADFQSDSLWISQRLGVDVESVDACVERLFRMGILTTDQETQRLKRTSKRIESPDDILNLSIQKAHLENFNLAEEALLNIDVKDRDYSLYTMAIEKEKIPEIKKMIREFQDELSRRFSSGSLNEVYRISMQLFPLTQLEKNK